MLLNLILNKAGAGVGVTLLGFFITVQPCAYISHWPTTCQLTHSKSQLFPFVFFPYDFIKSGAAVTGSSLFDKSAVSLLKHQGEGCLLSLAHCILCSKSELHQNRVPWLCQSYLNTKKHRGPGENSFKSDQDVDNQDRLPPET